MDINAMTADVTRSAASYNSDLVSRSGVLMIRVLIADDHPVVRQGIQQVLASTEDLLAVGEAVTGPEVLQRVRDTPVDLVLLDLSMPGLDGLDVLKQLRRDHPRLPVLVLTMHSEDVFAVRALKAGAAGYLTKESPPSELVMAIRKVATGAKYISPVVAERLAAHLGPDADKPAHERLSDREYQVLRLIAAGQTSRQISAALSLSVKTVGTYRTRIFEKMKLRNAAELTAYVVRNGLVD